MLERINDNIKI